MYTNCIRVLNRRILPLNADRLTAEKLINRINQTVKTELSKTFSESDVNLSMGQSIFPEDGQTFDKLVTIADNKMYQVKTLSKNGE
ncbi:diguanylate cyclase domain-containing protein [Paucisalibacillus globulus]|uniref:diguanylate cyclase domain-containing protein n=1 Tax=Paucisalibacillus globulus TaxID=351095 RepID=UPI000A07A1BB